MYVERSDADSCFLRRVFALDQNKPLRKLNPYNCTRKKVTLLFRALTCARFIRVFFSLFVKTLEIFMHN